MLHQCRTITLIKSKKADATSEAVKAAWQSKKTKSFCILPQFGNHIYYLCNGFQKSLLFYE